ncbi:P-loop NTPase family protein [Nocardia callitridis]|uniref:DNA topology modulation protein n=1 Tax=Nocardia callitridis TaxID=648753 RepID=A0ABP9KE89_9NOCA
MSSTRSPPDTGQAAWPNLASPTAALFPNARFPEFKEVPSVVVDQRIMIVGSGGSGKTYLAHQLADLLHLPVTHLDSIYYDADWNPIAPSYFEHVQRELVSGERWIIEGNYVSTLPIRLTGADTVIFLDIGALTCLFGIARRRWRYRGGQHRDGVYDRITWSFLRYVAGYRKTMRPRVLALTEQHGQHARLITLTSHRQVRRYLDHHTPARRG